MTTGFVRFWALVLAFMISLSGLPVYAIASDSETPSSSLPSEPSDPPESQPEEPQPKESQPEESQPEESQPEESQPEESQPEESQPEESQPEESQPEESQPEESQPEESQPEESQPEESQPEESQPEESQPELTLPDETIPEETIPDDAILEESQSSDILPLQEDPEISGPGLYFGLLHSHSAISDDTIPAEDLFAAASRICGLDFFAVTDHSDSFDNHNIGSIRTDGSTISTDWAAGKAAAAAVTNPSFVGIYGYEMSWPANMQIGHISTFCTPGFQSWQQDAYNKYNSALQNYYDALASVPDSVSQFNHPGFQYGTFLDFEYSEAADRAVSLLEIGSSSADMYRYYIKALDLGWHLAPTGNRDNAETARTVVYAQSLTESDIYDALRNYRVYTTEDTDLEILYTMNGHSMGSRLKRHHIGETIQISVSLNDPSGDAIGQVEIITNGGITAVGQTLSAAAGTLEFCLPAESGYYFLRITQPDGDIAVTAPIWVEAEEQLGISEFTCETAVPIQNEEILLNLELYNGEDLDFHITGLEISADGISVPVSYDFSLVPAGSRSVYPITVTTDCAGQTELTVRLTGTMEGIIRSFEASLCVTFHQSRQITAILIDGSHGNADIDQLHLLNQMAASEQIRLYVAENGLPAEALKFCRFLLVSAPSVPFSDAFLNTAAVFADYGGSIVVCGQADSRDTGIHSAAELNRLLQAVGSTMRMEDNLMEDNVNNSADNHILPLDSFNFSSDWCESVSENQVYRLSEGCSVDPGNGTWLVQGRDTTAAVDGDNDGLGSRGPGDIVTLACEPLSGGGTVFAAGSLFLSDANMAPPENIWDKPYANRTIAQTLLGIGGAVLPLSTIAEARSSPPGTLVRIRGYATTGTSNPYNSFPNILYLQDDTGGMIITPFDGKGIQQGTPLEVVGFTGRQGANHFLKTSTWKITDGDLYQYLPLEGSWDTLLDLSVNSQRLVQVEGKCLEIYCREDGTLAGCLLTDDHGNSIRIKVEDYIFNGSDGENVLQETICKNRTVRAMGLLHMDKYGQTVIRVRNCEEVVWVPPPRDPNNPPTGDYLLPVCVFSASSSFLGLLLLKKRKTT